MGKPVRRHLAAAKSPLSAFHYNPGREMCLFVLTMHDVISQTGSRPSCQLRSRFRRGTHRILQMTHEGWVPGRTAAGWSCCGKPRASLMAPAPLPLGSVNKLKHFREMSCWDCVGAECPLQFIHDKERKMQLRVFAGAQTPSGRKMAFLHQQEVITGGCQSL